MPLVKTLEQQQCSHFRKWSPGKVELGPQHQGSPMAARGTKRPQNACRKCGHRWYPRGNNRSLKCPSCGNGEVKNVGLGALGAVLLLRFLILSGGSKDGSSSAATTANRSPSSSVVQRPIGGYTPYSSRGLMQDFDTTSGAQEFSAIPVPLAPEPSNSSIRVKQPALNVPRAPNGAACPTVAGYVDGFESRDYCGSVVNLVSKKEVPYPCEAGEQCARW